MRRPVRLLSALTLLIGLAAGGCTKSKFGKASSEPKIPPAGERVVNLYIWAEYTSRELLTEFTKRTGIKVQESNFASNEELLAKLQAGATGFDLAVPSDYMVAVMAKLDMLRELDKGKIPNHKNLDPKLLGRPFDPTNKLSLPYAWSITGLAINRARYAHPVSSWADLLANEHVKGRASVLDDSREAIGSALKLAGLSLNTTDAAALAQAKATLTAAKANIKAFNSTPTDLLTSGEVVMAQMYSGEALLAAHASGQKIDFVIPKEGATLAIDNLVLLKNAPNVEEAYALMNFLFEVEANVDFVSRMYVGPVVTGVKERLPKELQDNASLFPPEEILSRCEMMQDLGEATATYDRIWAEIKASSH